MYLWKVTVHTNEELSNFFIYQKLSNAFKKGEAILRNYDIDIDQICWSGNLSNGFMCTIKQIAISITNDVKIEDFVIKK